MSKKSDDIKEAGNQAEQLAFPIVGIGASAGGLEAFSALFKALPADLGMAYVLVQHLAPTHESMLTTLLARTTTMPVTEISDGLAVAPNHVYVIPPNNNLAILHGVLYLMPRDIQAGHYLPIDYFFRSLAEDVGNKAIGIILSGTASDGVLGLKEIKAMGGITFAQDEESAAYNGMPHNAVAAGCVDFILRPAEMAAELKQLLRHPYIAGTKGREVIEELSEGDENLAKIFLLLRQHSGNDFTYYKPSTIQRRIKRRMLLNKIDRITDYVRHLERTPAEVDALFHDILIHVTGFFRDPQAFDALAQSVFPNLMRGRPPDLPLRIWVPGCSTGEEVYSIAICLLEFLGDRASYTPIQFFGTDLDELAIEQARQAIYPEAISQTVSAERLRQYFVKHEHGYQVNRNIRDLCVFSRQNVFKDPPFSRLDMISCRNLLIYLGSVLQKRILPIFQYALKSNGYLLLGATETIGRFADLFRLVDKKSKIYMKKTASSDIYFDFTPVGAVSAPVRSTAIPSTNMEMLDLYREVDRLLLRKFAPPGVVVNEELEILQFRGHTGAYLEPAPGEASLKLLKMVREGLQPELSKAFTKALKSNIAVRHEGIRLYNNGGRVVSVEVDPIRGQTGGRQFFLITFQEAVPRAETDKSSPEAASTERLAADDNEEMQRLRDELSASKEYLHSIIEQQEVSNEELTSAYEEIQASNEELQSINEELETAKEELQSTNEELETVNDELESRNIELEQLSNDLGNLISGLSTAIIMVDKELRIRRFTTEAETVLNLKAGDRGQGIVHLKLNVMIPDLEQHLCRVIDTVSAEEIEVQDKTGHWYKVQLRPYKTTDNRIDGAVLAYFDIDAIKHSLAEAERARDYAEAIVAAMRYPLLVLDQHLRVISASAAFYETFQVKAKETVGNLLYRLGNGQWGIPALRQHLKAVLKGGSGFDDYVVEHDFETIGQRVMTVSGRAVNEGVTGTGTPMVLMQIEDMTGKKYHGDKL